MCHIRDTVFKMFLFLSCVYIFSFALCSSVLNVYALDDTEPTAVIKEPENPSELILEEFETEDITELVTPESTTEELKSITSTTEYITDSDTKENGIDNQKFQNVILLMLFVVFVVTLFIRYV